MSLKAVFEQFVGKIVHAQEFTQAIKRSGLDPQAIKPSRVMLRQRFAELVAAGEDVSLSEPRTYFDTDSIARIETAVLQCSDLDQAESVLVAQVEAETERETAYMEIAPLMKAVVMMHANQKIVDTYVQAAHECTDYSDAVAMGKLVRVEIALEDVMIKFTQKLIRNEIAKINRKPSP